MMIIGRIVKQEGPHWSADADAIGVFTHGTSRAEACAMLKDAIEGLVERPGFEVTVTEAGFDDQAYRVHIGANQPSLLAAHVLKYQREVHGLSLADVAKKLGVTSRNAYARYEQGTAEPSISKYLELLAVVAPEMALIVESRDAGKPKRKAAAK
jgi:DNA-binding XRE family transcriptional regulator